MAIAWIKPSCKGNHLFVVTIPLGAYKPDNETIVTAYMD